MATENLRVSGEMKVTDARFRISAVCSPCRECKHLRAQVNERGEHNGKTVCTTPGEMHRDFSCYEVA
jgi:hypothetical protein